MNIFVLDPDPRLAAVHMHDRHVVKMIVESAQILSTIQRLMWNNNSNLYAITHERHPCTLWASRSAENYLWLYNHFFSLCREYTYRYNRVHKSEQLLPYLAEPPRQLQWIGLTPFAIVTPPQYNTGDVVQSYRNYYIAEKVRRNFWTNRENDLHEWLFPFIEPHQYKSNIITLPGYYEEGEKPARGELFVFGSNLAGRHGKGAAKDALRLYGAVYGQGIGLQGRSYAIPTKDHHLGVLPLMDIRRRIKVFVDFTRNNPQLSFYITRVGCGLAGYKDEEVAPLFKGIQLNCRIHRHWYSIFERSKHL